MIRFRRGVLEIGSFYLNLRALAQALAARRGCIVSALLVGVALVVLLAWQPWRYLRGQGGLHVVAPADAAWSVAGVDGQGEQTVQVGAGRVTLSTRGERYFPATVSLEVSEEVTATVLLADALDVLATGDYPSTTTLLWPRPTVVELPEKTSHLAFVGSELVYQVQEVGGRRVYLLGAGGRVERQPWLEVVGDAWALAPSGQVVLGRDGGIYRANNLAPAQEVYTSTGQVQQIVWSTDSWYVVLQEAYKGYILLRVAADGQVAELAEIGRALQVVGETSAGVLLRIDGDLYLLPRAGEVTAVGSTYPGVFPGVVEGGDGYIYWLATNPNADEEEAELRAVWRANLESSTVPQVLTAGDDAVGILGVWQDQLYYVLAREDKLYLARQRADGSGRSTVLVDLGARGTELWAAPAGRRWLVYETVTSSRWGEQETHYRVLDFGEVQR